MIPRVVRRGRDRRIDVIGAGREVLRDLVRQVGIAHRRAIGGRVIGQRPDERVELDQVEQSARRDQSRHVVRPSSQIAEPAEDAVRGEHHVERALEAICRVVDVAFHELGLDSKLFGEGASGFDGLRREIDPYDGTGPFLYPRHRIHAGVALEMKQTLARDPRRKLSELNRVEGRPVSAQPSAEFFVARMKRSDCVPVGAIDDMSLVGARRARMRSTGIAGHWHLKFSARAAGR